MTISSPMDFGDFDEELYLQQLLTDAPVVWTAPLVPTATLAPMIAVPPVALTPPATFAPQDSLYNGLTSTDSLFDELFQGQLSNYYDVARPEVAELNRLLSDTIDPTSLALPSTAIVNTYFRETPNDPIEGSLDSSYFEEEYQNRLAIEPNDPHIFDDMPSLYWSPETQAGNSPEAQEESSSQLKEINPTIEALQSFVSEELKKLRAERTAFEDKVMSAISDLKTFAEETPVMFEIISNELNKLSQGQEDI